MSTSHPTDTIQAKLRRAAAILAVCSVALGAKAALVTDDGILGRYQLAGEGSEYPCLPWTIYWIDSKLAGQDPEVGDLVRFRSRGMEPLYPDGTAITKMIAAGPGDHIQVGDGELRINGQWHGGTPLQEMMAVPAVLRSGYTLKDGEYFMMGSTEASLDSRYWGTVKREQMTGLVHVVL